MGFAVNLNMKSKLRIVSVLIIENVYLDQLQFALDKKTAALMFIHAVYSIFVGPYLHISRKHCVVINTK